MLFAPSGDKALLLDFCLAGTQLTLGSAMYSRTVLDFDESFQLDCLLKVQSGHGCWVSGFPLVSWKPSGPSPNLVLP